MKHAWVKELTAFFESLGKHHNQNHNNSNKIINNTNSAKKSSSSRKIDINSNISVDKPIIYFRNNNNNNNKMDNYRGNNETNTPEEDNEADEHCVSIEKGKKIFENDKESRNSIRRKRSNFKKITSFDIFSGKIDDPDIPPIEAIVDEPGVYSREEINTQTPSSQHNPKSLSIRHSSRRKHLSKSQSNANSSIRNPSMNSQKKNLDHIRSKSIDKDDEKENKGVIIRMRDQLHYYEGKTKYQSMLPDIPSTASAGDTGAAGAAVQMRRTTSRDEYQSDTHKDDTNKFHSHQPKPIMQNSILIGESIMLNNSARGLSLLNTLNDDDDDRDYGDDDEDVGNYDGEKKFRSSNQYFDGGDEEEELEPNNMLTESFTDVKTIQMISQGPHRIHWVETEEGKKLIQLKHLSKEVIKWQETQFELITSEASYYKSIQMLVDKIYKSPLMSCTSSVSTLPRNNDSNFSNSILMTPLQKHHLFSNILEIHIISGDLLKALETRWRENPFLEDLSDIFIDFCNNGKLRPYITYLRNQQYQTDTFNQLLMKSEFQQVVREFERDPAFGMMNLSSLLLLPMQRPFRLKLLMVAVKNNTPSQYKHVITGCDNAIQALDQLIRDCSDGKILMEQKEQLLRICSRLRFPHKSPVSNTSSSTSNQQPQIPVLSPLTVGSRPLVYDGAVHIRGGGRYSCGRMYLFEDQLVISALKSRRWTSPSLLCVSARNNTSSTQPSNYTNNNNNHTNQPNVSDEAPMLNLDPPETVLIQWPRHLVLFEEEECCPLNNNSNNNQSTNIHVPMHVPLRHFRILLVLSNQYSNKSDPATTAPQQQTSPDNNIESNKLQHIVHKQFRIQVDKPQNISDWQNMLSPVQCNKEDQYEFNEVLVTKDYNPNDEEELQIRQGQILHISKRLTHDEALAMSSGREGRIPLSHVKFIGPTTMPASLESSPTPQPMSSKSPMQQFSTTKINH